MKLSELTAGETAVICAVAADGAMRARLASLNVAAGKEIRVLRIAPFGGGMLLEAEGVRLALRRSLASSVAVRRIHPTAAERRALSSSADEQCKFSPSAERRTEEGI